LETITQQWTDDDLIKYFTDRVRENKESMQITAANELAIEFSDCKTKSDVINEANMDYLVHPYKYKKKYRGL
jgi:hypothetical protein